MTAEAENTVWKIHGERLIDDTRRLRLSIASVELPDGVHFEQYVLRMPKAAMMVVLNNARAGEIIGAAALVGLLHVLAFPHP